MSELTPSKFTYNASALAVGGTFMQKRADGGVDRIVVPSLASVALSPSGGEGSSIVEGYDRNGVSFSLAKSSVVGYSLTDDEYVTESEVQITDLNLFDSLTIKSLHAKVVSTHFFDQPESTFQLEARYEGIEVDGEEVLPVLDVDLTDNCPTYSRFSAHVSKSDKSVAAYAERFGVETGILKAMLDRVDNPPLRASLTREIQVRDKVTKALKNHPAQKAYGIKVKGLGHVNFAEYQVKPGRRRVTLLRLDLETQPQPKEGKHFDLAKLIPQLLAKKQRRRIAAATGAGLASGDMNLAADETDVNTQAANTGGFGDISIASVDGNGSPPWKP